MRAQPESESIAATTTDGKSDMPCDTTLNQGQTIAQRAAEVRQAVTQIDRLIAMRKVQVKVGPQGAVAFTELSAIVRARMTDACIYRMLTRSGSAATKMALARAEQLAGRSVDRKVIASGVHSHDGGTTWHPRG
jgi:hypothetical protein